MNYDEQLGFGPKGVSDMKFSKLLSIAMGAAALLTVAAAPVLEASAADSYKVDGSHAFAVFKVMHLGVAPAYGMFRKIDGEFTIDDADPSKSTVQITIDASSVFTADKKRDEHLQGPDFFDAKQFPKMTFKSKSVARSGDTFKVTGDLTIKGKTKEVTLDMVKTGAGADPWGNTRIGFETTLRINRMDFGVDYMPDGLGKEVTLMLSLEGIQKK